MSLEQKIDELIATLQHTNSLLGQALAGSGLPPAEAPVPGNEQVAPAKAVKANPTPAEEPTFKDVKDAVLKLAAKGPDRKGHAQAKELLSKFGVGKITELRPEQFADVLKAVAEVSE